MLTKEFTYGVCLAPDVDLPPFPSLAEEDQDIIAVPPSDLSVCGPETPFAGMSYGQISSSAQPAPYYNCQNLLTFALGNNPMQPDVYRLAFYLYGKLCLLKRTIDRAHGKEEKEPSKRELPADNMVISRSLRVPVLMDPSRLDVVSEQDCEVMATFADDKGKEPSENPLQEPASVPEIYASTFSDPPGLAILDSGCTRTMHGAEWAARFEEELWQRNLPSSMRARQQFFRGVGGQIESNFVKGYPVGIAKINARSSAPRPRARSPC